MLARMQMVAAEGGLKVTDLYTGHIKKGEDGRRTLAHADALRWEQVDRDLRAHLEGHLHEAVAGGLYQKNFPCWYHPERYVAVNEVVSDEYDRAENRPVVEILEAMRDAGSFDADRLVKLGNVLAYKICAVMNVKNILLAIMRVQFTPELGKPAIPMVFATLCEMDDRHESLLDERQGRVISRTFHNVLKRSGVSKAVFFPSLDDEFAERSDLLVYASGTAKSWFEALEVDRKVSTKQEGKALVKMIAQQTEMDEVPADFLKRMGEELADSAEEGLGAEQVADTLEKVVGHGIDRNGFQVSWAQAFGSPEYRPAYGPLFAEAKTPDETVPLKLEAGSVKMTIPAPELERFRQVTVGKRTFLIMEVPESARVAVTKDLGIRIKKAENLDTVVSWMKE